MPVKEKIFSLRERLALVCSKAHRAPESIVVVAVSKGVSIPEIEEALAAGIHDIGENRVQEALVKYNGLSAKRYPLNAVKWHMVGHLQTNKARDAVRIFDLIHSVDSLRLAQEIDSQAAKIGKTQEILLEVKTSPEATKFGFDPKEVITAAKDILKLKNIKLKGLMTMAPVAQAPELTRPYFRGLKELLDKINSLQLTAYSLQLLSMGMTDDFEVAIEEGATIIRIGRGIFGSS